MARVSRPHQKGTHGIKPAKRPATPSSELTWPVFCLRHLQPGYDVDNLSKDERCHLLGRLRLLSKLEWRQIEQTHRHGMGKENIARTAIRPPLPSVVTTDIKLWSLRFSGIKPMIGFRVGAVFHLLWIDHNFSVYPHSGS